MILESAELTLENIKNNLKISMIKEINFLEKKIFYHFIGFCIIFLVASLILAYTSVNTFWIFSPLSFNTFFIFKYFDLIKIKETVFYNEFKERL